MRHISGLVGTGLMVASAVFAQNLTEYSAAAAGGTAGGAGGKSVSDSVNRVLGKVASTTAKAADKKPATAPELTNVTIRSVAPAQVEPLPVGGATSRKRAPVSRRLQAVKVAPPVAPPTVSRPEPAVEDVEKVTVGMKRSELMAKLGEPASKILIPDEGGLVEIYSYTAKGQVLGSVRLTNGSVVSVKTE